MDITSAVSQIKTLLTGDVVDLDLNDSVIISNINRAFMRAKPRFNFTDYIWLPYNAETNVIDLTSFDPPIRDIVRVYETPISKYSIVDPDVFYMRNFYNMMSMARLFMARSEIENLVSRDFMFVNGKLYLNEYWGANITVEAVVDYSDPSQIVDSFFVDWIIRYAIALTKETMARVRGKYTVRNAPYELDANQLRSEAKEEKEQLENELNSAGGFFFVDR